MWFRVHAVIKILELEWRVFVLSLPISEFHCIRVLATHNYNISQWCNSCFCSFSIPTSRIKFLLLVDQGMICGVCAVVLVSKAWTEYSGTSIMDPPSS